MSSTAGNHCSCKFPAKMAALHSMLSFVRNFAIKFSSDKDFLYLVELGCEEAIVNIIKHGYSGQGEGIIDIDCTIEGSFLKYTITDNGHPFNPLEFAKSQPTQSVAEQAGKIGMGVRLLLKSTNEIFYERVGDKNRLTIIYLTPD